MIQHKYLSISFILVCSLLLMCFTGCSYFGNLNNGDSGNVADDNNDNNTAGNNDTTVDNTNNEENKSPSVEGIPVDKESDVIESIFDYLIELHTDHDMLPSILEYKIDYIKQGSRKLLEITFDKSDFYFICGYDNYTGNATNYGVSRAKKCNWYRFDSAEDIPEHYNNEKCAYVFQFNKASSVVDMLEMGNVPMIDHFLWFLPEFEQGYNVKAPEVFDETIIYLCRTDYLSVWDEGTVYYNTSLYIYIWPTIRFVEIEGVKYTTILTKEVTHSTSNQSVREFSPEHELGAYYDYFKDVIEENIYVVDRRNGTDYYSCIKIDDLIKVIKEIISTT